MDKLTGTPEQFMHAAYFVAKVCTLDSDAETEIRADYGGEDGLSTELMFYGLILGQAVDEVWQERQEFPGVPAYDVSEEVAAEWMYAWLLDESVPSWPNEQAWHMLCVNMLRAWCDGKLEEFMALPYVYQTELCHKEINPYTLYAGAKFPNGERIDVDAVVKCSKGSEIPVNVVVSLLTDMPTGTKLVSFNDSDYRFWRTEGTSFYYYHPFNESWKPSTTPPSNAIEYQKLMLTSKNVTVVETQEEAKKMCAEQLDPHFKTPQVEQELNIVLDEQEESVELKPDREITEPVITQVYSLLQYKDLTVEATDEQMSIRYEGLEIVINGGKVESLKIPGFNV
ncbi:hypothetical protein SIPHO049v1_p0020 [Vibrio phage PS14A.1]|nr:hypothetical protein SIPHO049v1_p0020 [Vibrio phage PS14A.1]